MLFTNNQLAQVRTSVSKSIKTVQSHYDDAAEDYSESQDVFSVMPARGKPGLVGGTSFVTLKTD